MSTLLFSYTTDSYNGLYTSHECGKEDHHVVYELLNDEKTSFITLFFASFSSVSFTATLIVAFTFIVYAFTDIKILVFEDPETVLLQLVLSSWVWIALACGILSAAIAEVLSGKSGAKTHALSVIVNALFLCAFCYGLILLFMTFFNIASKEVESRGREHSILPHTLFGLLLIGISVLFFLRRKLRSVLSNT